jgi:hypothetical protein
MMMPRLRSAGIRVTNDPRQTEASKEETDHTRSETVRKMRHGKLRDR